MVISLFTMFAFALGGTILFGDHVPEFQNVTAAMFTMLYWCVGDFSSVDYEEMMKANSMVTPFFISAFLLVVVLAAINMFIAILNDFYTGDPPPLHNHTHTHTRTPHLGLPPCLFPASLL